MWEINKGVENIEGGVYYEEERTKQEENKRKVKRSSKETQRRGRAASKIVKRAAGVTDMKSSSRCEGQRKNSGLFRNDLEELKWEEKEGGWQCSHKSVRFQWHVSAF